MNLSRLYPRLLIFILLLAVISIFVIHPQSIVAQTGLQWPVQWPAGQDFKMTGDGEWSFDFNTNDKLGRWSVWGPDQNHILVVREYGQVGIGTIEPNAALDIKGGPTWVPYVSGGENWKRAISVSNRSAIEFTTGPGAYDWGIGAGNNPTGLYFMRVEKDDKGVSYPMMLHANGNVGIGTTSPSTTLDVDGTTSTDVLQITGGADIAEPFSISGDDDVQPGMVVAIDAEIPGQLRIARHAYDRTVAGIVSGAGGVNAGLIMQQDSALMVGTHPVALTGRVYVWADAQYGAIQPGDMMTTSDTLGHAMKVGNYAKAQGAILGKAMTGLDEGVGLVLVLVALQ